VILLDTHIWVWWVQGDLKLSASQQGHLTDNESAGLGVSVVSCWEVGCLVARGKLVLPTSVEQWVLDALAYPGVRLLNVTPEIAMASTRLPDPFHKDPVDRILVATARHLDIPILTADNKIPSYPHVSTLT
jgi:PIN domain nuclease of toxin-antitoxin system